jgi:hypothetical protein
MTVTETQLTDPSKAKAPERQRLILREFTKGIFFYPLAIFSFIAAIIEHIGESGAPTLPWAYANMLSIIWIVVFFINVFVVSFDFSAGKFILMILVVALIILVIFLLIQSGTIILPAEGGTFVLNLELRTQFYWMIAAILGAVVLLTLLVSRFRYVRIETNEVLVKGILGDVKRFPTANLHYEKKITDVFEYMALRAGSIILHISGAESPVELHTVANVHKKAQKMDALLSAIKISR